ncbi:MAG TPA: CPBP family intramembrane glutamic endopeptidase [Gaiellales bacterium]|nr:CPBP family intramembrane glutamic endopeptidase [Gaiellales bacterium]
METLAVAAPEPIPAGWRRLAVAGLALILFNFAATILVIVGGAVLLPRFHPLWIRAAILAAAHLFANACGIVAAYQIAFAGRRRSIVPLGLAPIRRVISSSLLYVVLLVVVTVAGTALTRAIGLDHGTTSIDTDDRSLRYRMVIAVVVVLVAPWIEEIAFRGLLLGALWSRFGFWTAAVVSGFTWAGIHLTPSVLIIFTAEGALLAWVRRRTGSILTGVGLHGAQNTLAAGVSGGGLAPLPVAGVLLATIIAADRYTRTMRA